MWNPSSLPSDVDVDCAAQEVPESRVPTLGLTGLDEVDNFSPHHHHKMSEMDDSSLRFDSGTCMSYGSGYGSLISGEGMYTSDTFLEQTQAGLHKLSIADRLPSISEDKSTLLHSIDEGFSSVPSLPEEEYKPQTQSYSSRHTTQEVPTTEHSHFSPQTQSSQVETRQKDISEYHRQFREQVIKIFSPDDEGDTQLHLAIINSAEKAVFFMLSFVRDPAWLNLSNNLRQTPLHLAVITEQPIIVRHLVVMGASLEQRDRHGNTALHLACQNGNHLCVQALTRPITFEESSIPPYMLPPHSIPQDTEIKNYAGETCLHIAASRKHSSVIDHLLSPAVQADINVRDGCSGRTALHRAVEVGDFATTLQLLTLGADANASTYGHQKPLILAFGRGHRDITDLLLGHGADAACLSTSSLEDSEMSDMDSDEESDDTFIDDLRIGGQPVIRS